MLSSPRRRSAVVLAALVSGAALLGLGACVSAPPAGPAEAPLASACTDPAVAPRLPAPPPPACDDARLARYAGLLVIAPHPDDEMLGFAGLVEAYLRQGKPVEVVVATDGDAYCEACRFWKTSSVRGATCGAGDLSDFATPAVDSFAEVRRGESTAAAAVLGLPAPAFLGYPDTGLGAAWRNRKAGELDRPLHRSDFSLCGDCETCEGGYGDGPATELTAATLIATLRGRIAAAPPGTLLATTHPLDGHGDHAALGRFVRELNAEKGGAGGSHAVVYSVIHAHTPKDTRHPDCWYPGPRAVDCACMVQGCAEADPAWIGALARHRFRPEWPAELPDDADYGEEVQLCLSERMYRGEGALKLRAVAAYGSQLGDTARAGAHPPGLARMLDCSGYLMSFVRRTEAFALVEAGEAPPTSGEVGTAPAAGGSRIAFGSYSPAEDAEILAAFEGLRVADVSDGLDAAGLQDVGLVDPAIAALWRDVDDFSHRFAGIAVTVRYVPTNRRAGRLGAEEFGEWEGDWYERLSPEPFVEHLRPGSAVVIDGAEDGDTGSIGSYNILAWQLAGAVGVVTSGGARDTDEIIKQRVPLYLRRLGRGIRPGRNEVESVQRPVTIGGVLVRPGDVVVADGDGVVVVPRERAAEVAAHARRVLADDKEARRELYREAGLPEDASVRP